MKAVIDFVLVRGRVSVAHYVVANLLVLASWLVVVAMALKAMRYATGGHMGMSVLVMVMMIGCLVLFMYKVERWLRERQRSHDWDEFCHQQAEAHYRSTGQARVVREAYRFA